MGLAWLRMRVHGCSARRQGWQSRFAAVLLGLAVALGPQASTGIALDAPATPLLPDLDQALPRHLAVERVMVGDRARVRLGFDSAAANMGPGPLLVHGTRRSRTAPTMRADQLVRASDGSLQITKGVGGLRFIRLHDHWHWYFLDFERYEIRDDRTLELVTRDRKTGFCIGDRYRVERKINVLGRAAHRVYGDNCAPNRPRLMGIFEGLSPGFGDRYKALLEGQHIDISRLHSGIYQLVHRVNPAGRLIETTLANNSATLRLRIVWTRGHEERPDVTVLGVCPNAFGCAGAWWPGARPVPSDLQGTPFGAALAS